MSIAELKHLLPLLLLLQPLAASGQATTHTLRPGDDVRVHAPSVHGARLRGTVMLYQGETLQMREAGTGAVLSIPVKSIRALARNQGMNRGRSSWRMARLGGFVGGAGGFVAGPLIATSRAPNHFGEIMLVSGLAGTAIGTASGAVLGAVFARDQWQRFRMPIIATVAARRRGLAVRLTAAVP